MTRFLIVMALGTFMSGCASARVESPSAAQAVLKDRDGLQVAAATFTEGSAGVRIQVTASGLRPGAKGVHIHTVGKCEPPEFTSAGAHFNPIGKKHGRQNPEGAHAGDLPNLVVSDTGSASFDVTTKAVTLQSGLPTSLFGPTGASLVIHAQQDDEKTDPTGNSGGRIACGVITR
jgi:superoxide dismutase, Cu-Zn family